jgi:NAD(P)-dependent dehydrogenase (short-subunit alcohol dehydrogenase family)
MAHALRHAQDTGGVDVCVANAGIMLLEDFLDSDPESWEAVIRINLLGVMTTLQLAAAQMAKRARGGRLLATTSVAGIRGDAGSAAYSASKAGVIAVTQTLAAELAPLHITVNAVAPGEIDTPMHADTMRRLAEANKTTPQALRRDLLNRRVPARRMGSAVEVAALFAYLASDDAAYITGETIRIDGGWWLV